MFRAFADMPLIVGLIPFHVPASLSSGDRSGIYLPVVDALTGFPTNKRHRYLV